MPDDTASTQLLHQRHTVLILRLTVDQHSQLYQGSVVALNEQLVGQFRDWPELVALLQQWLATKPATASA